MRSSAGLRALLTARARMLRNRVRRTRHGALAPAVLALAAGGLAVAVWAAGRDTLPAQTGEALVEALRSRVFWVNVAMTFVAGFTSFEVIFRAPFSRYAEALPVPTGALFGERMVAQALNHAPLLMLALAFELSMVTVAPGAFSYAAAIHGATWLLVLGVGTWLHILAGRSLLSGDRGWKGFLGYQYQLNAAAMLLYSPAGAFGGALFLAVPLELIAREQLVGAPPGPTLGAVAVAAALSLAAVARAAVLYRRHWRSIRARFTETEILRPFREDHLPRHYVGAVLLRWLAPRTAALYRKDLVQLRRRHRLDVPLLVASVGAVIAWHVRGAEASAEVWFGRDAALTVALGWVFLNPVFKLAGDELEPHGLLATLGVAAAEIRRGKGLLALVQIVPVVAALAVSYTLKTGDALGGLVLAGCGIAGGYALSRGFLLAVAGPRPVGAWVGWAVRGAALTLAVQGLGGA